MRATEALARLGGVADSRTLRRHTSRRAIRAAVHAGEIVRDCHARYALPTADEARRAANRLTAVVSHRSAAAAHGWELKTTPERPEVTVPRNRNVAPGRREDVQVYWADLTSEEIAAGVTSHLRTVLDCARWCLFDEGLTAADSAIRHGDITAAQLLVAAGAVRGKGRRRCLRVARHADGRAANPFESVLRAIALDVPGLTLTPQHPVDVPGGRIHPDLTDQSRRLALEADSFSWHGDRRALVRDCARYNALALAGWRVLRFTWEHVMLQPGYVRWCLEAAVRGTGARATAGDLGCRAA